MTAKMGTCMGVNKYMKRAIEITRIIVQSTVREVL